MTERTEEKNVKAVERCICCGGEVGFDLPDRAYIRLTNGTVAHQDCWTDAMESGAYV